MIKKIESLIFIIGLFLISACAAPVNVKSLDTVSNGSMVTLEGNIIEQLQGDDDLFLFKDSSGSIKVEIDDDAFPKEKIKPETKVIISAEVEHLLNSVKLEVKRIEIAK